MRRVAIGAVARTLGGPATYAIELVRALAARRTPGLEYVVLTDGPEAFDGIPVAVEHLPLRTPWAQPLWDHGRVPHALRRIGADLYHGTKNAVPVRCPCPAVVTIHDLAVYHHPETFALAQRWHLRAETPHAVRVARTVLTVSEHAAADLRARFPRFAAKVRVVPNGVSPRFRPLDDAGALRAFRARHGLGAGPLIAYLGTLQPRKNVELLAAAFRRAAPALPGAELVLAGRIRPGYRPDLPRERVRLIGPLADAELPLFYGNADVLVNPSLYEGFGLTLVEAMACGCPVIALRRSAVPEVTGDAALLIDEPAEAALAQALVAMVGTPATAAAHRALGLERATEFSWARAAAAVEAVYLGALDPAP
ncbi:MAG: glycosyltransferase family 4 protein [Deltaproteobacteria bacterium]|nr:glycosyltransferase family 4 protein [Deltaproteobacteria bacterium]